MKFTLLKIEEIIHVSANGEVLWRATNLPNLFHRDGEEYCLRALFAGETIPTNYYFGLDNRSSLAVADTMTTIATEGAEPSSGGYFRQAVGSSDQFQVSIDSTTKHAQALSPIVTFVASASGGGWGPVSNLFLTNKSDNTGYLVSSVALNQTITVAAGAGVHMRMSLSLGDCPDMPVGPA